MKDHTGRVEVLTNVSMIDTIPVAATSEEEKRRERVYGPLFRIVATTDMIDEAQRRVEEIKRRYGGRARVDIVPSSKEMDAFLRGEFRVLVDGKDVLGSGSGDSGK